MGFGDCDYVTELLVMAEKMVADIGPKLFRKIVSGVKGDARSHGIREITGVALIIGIVRPANPARSCAGENLRSIEYFASRIGTSYKDASYRVPGARKHLAASHTVIARIGVED